MGSEMCIRDRHSAVLDVISVMDLFRGIDDSISYGTEDGLPPDVPSASASMDWVAKIEPELVASLINKERNQARVRVMTRSMGFRDTNRLAKDFENTLSMKLGPEFTVASGGTYSLIGSALAKIVTSQIVGFFICIFASVSYTHLTLPTKA